MIKPQNSLERNHKKCYSTDHIECYSEPQKMLEQKRPQKAWEGRPHHKKWGISIYFLFMLWSGLYRKYINYAGTLSRGKSPERVKFDLSLEKY